MLALAMVLVSLALTALFVSCFLGWVLREHLQANKYRELVRLATTLGPITPAINMASASAPTHTTPAPETATPPTIRVEDRPMDVRKELKALGFVHAGAICPVDSGKSCKADLKLAFPGHAVYALVVGDQIKKFGKTSTGIKKRIGGHASALKGIMENPTGHPLDPFKRLAPEVIESSQEIEVWAKESTASTYALEEGTLNRKYKPEWVGRPD